jgi:DNA modification methylase
MAKKEQLTIELQKLKANPDNPRKHSERQIAEIQKSLAMFGQYRPIIVDTKNTILAGHGLVEAMRQAGMTEGEVIRYTGLSDSQKKKLMLADNQLQKMGDDDQDMIDAILRELEDDYVPGFDPDVIKALREDEQREDETRIEEEEEIDEDGEWLEYGDIFLLGDHRLMLGDSTMPADVQGLMIRPAQLVFTDPPYGVDYQSEAQGGIEGDDLRDDELLANLLIPAMKNAVANSLSSAAFYVWHASVTRRDFEEALDAAGLEEKQYIVWVKPSFVMGRADYHWQHEPCFYAQKAGESARYIGDRKQATIWKIGNIQGESTISLANGLRFSDGEGHEVFIRSKAPKNAKYRLIRLKPGESVYVQDGPNTDSWEISPDSRKEYIHPTQKPTALAKKAIRNHLERGEIVCDLFAGSGSTLMAAEETERVCYAMDYDPKFVARIIRRWEEATGRDAIHEESGKTYEELIQERADG